MNAVAGKICFFCVDLFSFNLFFFRFWCVWFFVFLFLHSFLDKIHSVAWTKTFVAMEKKSYLMWPDQDYFGHASCTFQLEKENMPENTIYYLNQCHISYKDNKKIYYGAYFILPQVLQHETPPQDIQSYVLG